MIRDVHRGFSMNAGPWLHTWVFEHPLMESTSVAQTCANAGIHTDTHVRAHRQTQAHALTYTNTCVRAQTHMRVRGRARARMHACDTYAHLHTRGRRQAGAHSQGIARDLLSVYSP